MSRDSSVTYVHSHHSHHADLFEEFCHPPSANAGANNASASNTATNANVTNTNDPGMIQISGHFLPFEEISLPAHLMPVNPEDEDDVVPDMHAAFGIQHALNDHQGTGMPAASGEGSGRGAQREPIWRDLGLHKLLETGGAGREGTSAQREGKKTGLLLMR